MKKKVGGGEITFYIEEWWNDPMLREYKALQGMTWGEWVNSDYNTNGFYTESNYIKMDDGITLTVTVNYEGGAYVTVNSVIIATNNYGVGP